MRRETEPCTVVRLPDGLQIAVPSWMLDPGQCEGIRDAESPVIAIEALRGLAELVGHHLLLLRGNVDSSSCTSNDLRGDDEQGSTSPLPNTTEKA